MTVHTGIFGLCMEELSWIQKVRLLTGKVEDSPCSSFISGPSTLFQPEQFWRFKGFSGLP